MRTTPSLRWLAGLLASLLLAFATPALAQEPVAPADDAAVRALIEQAGDQGANDGADLVTVLKRTDVTVEDSGLSHIRNREIIKCLSEQGAAELARLRLDFDPASNVVEVETLRIFRADGTVEELDTAGVDLPQPQWAIYWGAQMKLLPLPRLEPGDAVEVASYMKGFLIAYLDDQDSPWGPVGGGQEPAPTPEPEPEPSPAPPALPPAAAAAVEQAQAQASEPVVAAPPEDDESRYIPPMRGHFYDVVYFHDHHPVKQRHYTVRTPLDKPLQYEVHNGEVQAYVTFDEQHHIHSFWRTDVPAYHEEGRYSEEYPDTEPKVVMATVPDWGAKSRWFAQVNEPQFAATPAIEAKVREITAGLSTDEQKIRAINHWAANEIRYSGISMGKGEGYTLHTGEMIFRDRSGVCKDKAGMAIVMLRAAGYTVYPAMTMAGSRVERVPADQFNHCVVALQGHGGDWLMLDPTWVTFSPENWSSAEGEQHYVIGTPEGEELMMTPAFPPEDNKLVVRASTAIDAEGTLSGTVTFSGHGYAEQRLRREMVHYTTARDRQAWFEGVLAQLGPQVQVEPVTISYAAIQDVETPVSYTARFRVPDYAVVTDDGMVFAQPTAGHLLTTSRVAPYLGLGGDAERSQGLLIWAPRMREVHETLTLPPGYSLAHQPADVAIDHEIASLHSLTQARGRRITYTQDLRVKRRFIPAEQYADFAEVVNAALELPDDTIVLERR
jgi:transglutaminase-like putative cysteine protease